jgi:hypothetical protein
MGKIHRECMPAIFRKSLAAGCSWGSRLQHWGRLETAGYVTDAGYNQLQATPVVVASGLPLNWLQATVPGGMLRSWTLWWHACLK